MALIDCARFKPTSDEFVFAYRIPETNLSTYTQLIVYESQEALLFSKGQLMQKFGPGKHTLDTENIPILRKFFGIPFGGNNPFTAEIWIVNKLYPSNLEWMVGSMPIHDADYQTMIPLYVKGQYGMQVSDSEKFMIKMVGTKDVFTESDMLSQANGEFSSKVKSAVLQFMNSNRIGLKSVSASIDSLSNYLKPMLNPFWEDYGITLTRFYITEVDIDKSTDEGRKISEAIATQASMKITGHSWQQEQAIQMGNNALEQMGNMGNMGGSGGLLGGIMAMNMIGGMSGNFMGAGMYQTHNDQPSFGGNNQNNSQSCGASQGMGGMSTNVVKEVYCAKCSKKHLSTEKFCPHCGNEYNPCPCCGSDNSKTAKRCVSCGTVLQSSSPLTGGASCCYSCGAPLAPGAAFCPQCGAQQKPSGNGLTCPRCGASIMPNSKFCPKCGQKI